MSFPPFCCTLEPVHVPYDTCLARAVVRVLRGQRDELQVAFWYGRVEVRTTYIDRAELNAIGAFRLVLLFRKRGGQQ